MKKFFLICSIFLFSFSYSINAQFGNGFMQSSLAQNNKNINANVNVSARGSERIKQLKTVYMVKELDLKKEEQVEFWKTYGRYEDDLNKLWVDNRSDRSYFENKSKQLQKAYLSEFKIILGSDERANKVFSTDVAFRQMLRKELKGRRD